MTENDFLGYECEDIITGFKGTCIGFVKYITGCNQYLITPKCGAENKTGDATWFDVQRIKLTNDKKIELDNGDTPGCDLSAPIK